MIKIFKNRYGLVRSGWIIILCLILYYALLGVAQIFIIATMRKLLEITGNLDYSTGFSIPPVDTMNDVQFAIIQIMPEIVTEIVTIALSLITWKIMRYDWKDIGIGNFDLFNSFHIQKYTYRFY